MLGTLAFQQGIKADRLSLPAGGATNGERQQKPRLCPESTRSGSSSGDDASDRYIRSQFLLKIVAARQRCSPALGRIVDAAAASRRVENDSGESAHPGVYDTRLHASAARVYGAVTTL